MNCKLRPSPQLRSLEIQIVHPNPPEDRQPTQKRDTLPNPQVNIHASGEEDSPKSEETPYKIIARKQTGSVLRVTEGDIRKDRLKDDEDSQWVNCKKYCWSYPVNVRSACPCE